MVFLPINTPPPHTPLGLDFLNFDWDLACAYRNVRKCTTCKHNSYDIYDMIPKKMCVL